MCNGVIGIQDRGAGQLPPPPNFGKPWKFGKIGKIKNIWADLSENILNSGYFSTILPKNLGKLSTAPHPGKHLHRTAMDGVRAVLQLTSIKPAGCLPSAPD